MTVAISRGNLITRKIFARRYFLPLKRQHCTVFVRCTTVWSANVLLSSDDSSDPRLLHIWDLRDFYVAV